MKIQYGLAITALNTLFKLKDSSYNMSTTFKLLKNCKELEGYKADYDKTCQDAIKRLGTINEEDGSYFLDKNTEAFTTYVSEVNELLLSEIEVNILKIKEEDLIKSNVELSISELSSISFMIEEV